MQLSEFSVLKCLFFSNYSAYFKMFLLLISRSKRLRAAAVEVLCQKTKEMNDENIRALHDVSLINCKPIPVVRAFAHGAMGRRIDPSWWTH